MDTITQNDFDITTEFTKMSKEQRIKTTTAMLLVLKMLDENKLTDEEYKKLFEGDKEVFDKVSNYISETMKG